MSNRDTNSSDSRSSNSRMSDSRKADTRMSGRPTVRLDYERSTGRQLGFMGFSIVAHTAFLAALAFSTQSLKPIQEIGGGDGLEAGTGGGTEISIVEVNDAGQPLASISAEQPSNQSTLLTDESSTITAALVPSVTAPITPEPAVEPVAKQVVKRVVQPVTLPATKPAPRPIAKMTAKPIETKPLAEPQQESSPESKVITEEVAEAPILLANPPEDQPEEIRQEMAEEPTPVLAAGPIMPTKPEPQPESQAEPVPEPMAAQKTEQQPEPQPVSTVVAQPEAEEQPEPQPEPAAALAVVAQKNQTGESAERKSEQAESAASAAPPSESASGMGNNQSGTGSTNESKGTGSGTVISGPIRDASELKALPGNPNPVYPARDRFNRKQGTTFVLGRVMPDGRIGQVVLEKSSGSPSMDAESAKAFRNWRFQPGQQGWVRKPFQFRLVGDAKEVPAALGKQLKRQ